VDEVVLADDVTVLWMMAAVEMMAAVVAEAVALALAALVAAEAMAFVAVAEDSMLVACANGYSFPHHLPLCRSSASPCGWP